jgi:septal ring factor EnvC (AmiA/AmiB activator)
MGVRHVSLLLAFVAPAAGAASVPATTPSVRPPATKLVARAASTSPAAVRYCKRPEESGCVDPIVAALDEFEKECLAGKQNNAGCYEDLRDQVRAGQKKVLALEAEVARLKTDLYTAQHPTHRSRDEVAHANQVFDDQFGYLRKDPEAFQLARELIIARMNAPRFARVPLDMIVRDVASRVAYLTGNTGTAPDNEKRIAELEQQAADAKRQAAESAAAAQQAINAAADHAELDALETMNAAAILSHDSPPPTPTMSPYIRCTSRSIGNTVRTDCQ